VSGPGAGRQSRRDQQRHDALRRAAVLLGPRSACRALHRRHPVGAHGGVGRVGGGAGADLLAAGIGWVSLARQRVTHRWTAQTVGYGLRPNPRYVLRNYPNFPIATAVSAMRLEKP